MAEAFIQLPADSTGKKVRTFEQTVGANVVEHQAFVICDSSGNIIGSLASQPAGTEQGIVTRPASAFPDVVAGPTNITAASGFAAIAIGAFSSSSPAASSSVSIATNGASSLAINVTGTWVATLQFEATVDGTNWTPINAVGPAGGTLLTSATGNGLWVVDCAGMQNVRVRASAYTSGTAVVTMRASHGSVPGQIAAAGADATGTERTLRTNVGGYLIPPLQWVTSAIPAAGSQASITRAASAGVTHVCTGVLFSLGNSGTGAAINAQTAFRDGVSGTGSLVMSFYMSLSNVGGDHHSIYVPMNFAGTAGNAMTAEFTAGIGGVFQSITLFGYDL